MTSQLLSRRQFLRETLFGVAVLGAAKLLPQSWLFAQTSTAAGHRLRYFSSHEYAVLQAIAERLIGPSAKDHPGATGIDAAARADAFLAGADPEIQEQFHLLLTIFDSWIFTFFMDQRVSSFLRMGSNEQYAYLEDWMTSRLGFRRTGFTGLKHLCMSMYYTDPRTWDEFDYLAVSVPGEAR